MCLMKDSEEARSFVLVYGILQPIDSRVYFVGSELSAMGKYESCIIAVVNNQTIINGMVRRLQPHRRYKG
jgi:hypothetical protein